MIIPIPRPYAVIGLGVLAAALALVFYVQSTRIKSLQADVRMRDATISSLESDLDRTIEANHNQAEVIEARNTELRDLAKRNAELSEQARLAVVKASEELEKLRTRAVSMKPTPEADNQLMDELFGD